AVVMEKTITLALALRTAAKLRASGYQVVLSRTDDGLPGASPADFASDGTELTPDGVLADLQRRIDRANTSAAPVLLSIHLDGFDDPTARGSQTFYDSSRPFGAASDRLAGQVQSEIVAAFRSQGDDTPDRGVTDDAQLDSDSLGAMEGYNHLVLLG